MMSPASRGTGTTLECDLNLTTRVKGSPEVRELLELAGQMAAQSWGAGRLTPKRAENIGRALAAGDFEDFGMLCAIGNDPIYSSNRDRLHRLGWAKNTVLA